MIVQAKRPSGLLRAVLKGSQFTITTGSEHIELSSWGIKEKTGEPYEFRVLLTRAEWKVIKARIALELASPEHAALVED